MSPYCDQYGGFVMNAAIDKYAYAMVDAAVDDACEFVSLDHDVCWSGWPDDMTEAPQQVRLIVGVYRRICAQFLGANVAPVRIRTYSDAPPGSGLGSSSTLVVAVVTALAEYYALPLGEYEIAHLAYSIEREDLALAGGKQDQYAAAFGGVNFMEFHGGDRVIVNPLRIKDWVLAELEASLVLYFTGVSRESARIIDEQVRNTQAGVATAVDAMHALKSEAVQMKEALLKGDFGAFAQTFQKGWEAKKRMASSVSNPMIDELEVLAAASGAVATKVSGAGGGGFMMFVCDPGDRVRLSQTLQAQGGRLMNFHFNPNGATAWRAGR